MTSNDLLLFIPPLLHSSSKASSCSEFSSMTRKKKRTHGVFAGSVGKVAREMPRPLKRKFYAVKYGRDGFAGVLTSWDECTLYVTGVKGAVFKSFKTYEEAQNFAFPSGEASGRVPLQTDGDPSENNENPMHLYVAEPAPDAPRKVCAYTDGACSKNGTFGSKAGYGVFFHEESPYNVSEPLPGPPTNQRAEMTAVLEAMQIVLQHALVAKGGILEVYTDSMYTKNGIETWTSNWKRNNWKTTQGTDVKNKDLWIALDITKEALWKLGIEVSLIWVKGHSGIPGNEAADRLAVSGMSRSV